VAPAEQRRRGKKSSVSVETSRIEAAVVNLTPGELNAVRAAFKAGVKRAQIARQFGLSHSDVRKALARR
jgi:predicted DNA binding protein